MSPKSPEKIKEHKIKGKKNINLQSFHTTKTINTLLYIDDEVLKVKTLVNIDGTLEIFIENPK
ncbi:MAG: hypothetical protein LLF83_10530 [Methanobacterium sp.]|nr:hypothetical protein [Methanobacterium sp.]